MGQQESQLPPPSGKPGEAVLLRVTEVCKGWTGTLKLGFTAHNPEELTSLPKSTSPALTRKAGHWVKSPPTRLIKHGALLHCPLWCLIDLYGSCTAIELE